MMGILTIPILVMFSKVLMCQNITSYTPMVGGEREERGQKREERGEGTERGGEGRE
jgi:hypothetical protein